MNIKNQLADFVKYPLLATALIAGLDAHALKTVTGVVPVTAELSKVQTWVGEGDARVAVVMKWNDGLGMDNIVAGVRFDPLSSLTPQGAIEALINADPRYYAPESGGWSFDLNGDLVRDDATYTRYDHNGTDGVNGEWVICSPGDALADGQTVYAYYCPTGSAPIAAEYLFYLPAADVMGVWMADGLQRPLADDTTVVPLYMNLGGGVLSSMTVSPIDAASRKKVSKVGFADVAGAKKGDMRGLLTFGSEPGDATMKLTMRYYETPEDKRTATSDATNASLTVTEPVIPVERVEFKNSVKVFHRTETADLSEEIVIIPENATYKGKFSYKTDADRTIFTISGSKLYAKSVEGEGIVTVTRTGYPDGLTATMEAQVRWVNPVEAITFNGIDTSEPIEVEFDSYKLEYNYYTAPLSVIPANADISTLKMVIDEAVPSLKATFAGREYDVVSYYKQKGIPAHDINCWGEGDVTLHFEATDGSEVKSEPIILKIRKRHGNVVYDQYQDGTFWLNEEWFGHSNGSINYLDADRKMHYRVYNAENVTEESPLDNTTFGCTSQYGIIHGDRLYVMSKQAHDQGDRYYHGGGRLVIADAKTLKRLHSFDVLGSDEQRGGDGRACVGVSPDKVYLGLHNSIRVLNIDNAASTPEEMFTLGKEIVFKESEGGSLNPGDSGGALYSNQIGDMLCIGKYVFAVMQDKGILVIDTDKDEWVSTLGNQYAQAITQSADGNLWYALNDTKERKVVSLHCINPATLEEIASYDLPEGAGTINTGWGAWRSANFFASKSDNVLFWGNVGSGYQDDILGKGTGCIFRWKIGEELPSEPFFNLGQRPGMNASTFQSPYATMRYDDRTDEILMATTHGASTNYRYEWIYFINGTTGEIDSWQQLRDYFWFPAIPIFPDKYAPEINIDRINVPAIGESQDIDLSEYVTDIDNIDYNIRIALPSEATVAEVDASGKCADYLLDGKKLTITGLKKGQETVTLSAESNGKVTTREIPVFVGDMTGIDGIGMAQGSITADGDCIILKGYAGWHFTVTAISGATVASFDVTTPSAAERMSAGCGVYVIRGTRGNDIITSKIVIQ